MQSAGKNSYGNVLFYTPQQSISLTIRCSPPPMHRGEGLMLPLGWQKLGGVCFCHIFVFIRFTEKITLNTGDKDSNRQHRSTIFHLLDIRQQFLFWQGLFQSDS